MYIDSIALKNFRTFRSAEVSFLHPDQDFTKLEMRRVPKLSNVNLLLGANGSGKTALLKAIALACLGPAVSNSGIYPYRLVRREPTKRSGASQKGNGEYAILDASFTPHPQDRVPAGIRKVESKITIERKGDLEQMQWSHADEKTWHPIFLSESAAFFFVGYGASRTVERRERSNPASRQSSAFVRAQRVKSLFEEDYPLVPLESWLPEWLSRNKGRYTQVTHLINRTVGSNHYHFTGEMDQGEYLYAYKRLQVPFRALSDGYRAYLGWLGDLLFHVCTTCPSGTKLVENRGIVLIDEIDLHIHPKWQMTVLPRLARELPNIQFIVTSHSPLIVGSLEWMNIVVMCPGRNQASSPRRIPFAVHGLDADQVLLTRFFGLQSTRVEGKGRRLKALSLEAREGDPRAAAELLKEMSRGMETPQ
jgi:predicted ATP-binding protein involved in virulence